MSMVASIYEIAQSFAVPNQNVGTAIPFLSINQSEKPTPITHGIVKPSLCLILQGGKEIQIGPELHRYGPGDFMISTIDLPVSGRIAKATKALPYLGLSIEIEPQEILALILDAKIQPEGKSNSGPSAFVSEADAEMMESFHRLVKLLTKPENPSFLAQLGKREIFYHLLTSKDGARFYGNVIQNRQEPGLHRAIHWIKTNFDQPLKVEALAKLANMSVSGFHHKFKEATTMGPLQYQKRIRLQEARQLLLAGVADISGAAARVGYESPSQFSREYNRLFGETPSKDKKTFKIQNLSALQN